MKILVFNTTIFREDYPQLNFANAAFGFFKKTAATIAATTRRLRRSHPSWDARLITCVSGASSLSVAGARSGLSSADEERLKALERENKELRTANEILKKASAYFAQAELDRPFRR